MRLLAHPSCLDDPSTSPASTHSPVVCSQALRLRASGCDVSAEVWTPWIWNLRQVTGCLGTFVIVLSWKTIVSFKITGLSNLKKARFHKLPNRVGKLAQSSAEPMVSCVEPLGDERVLCLPCKQDFLRGTRTIGSCPIGSTQETIGSALGTVKGSFVEDHGWKIHGETTAPLGRAVWRREAVGEASRAEGRGRAFAIAHLDELLQQAEKKEQARCERYQLLCGCLSRLWEVPWSSSSEISMDNFCFFFIHFLLGSFSLIVFLQQNG